MTRMTFYIDLLVASTGKSRLSHRLDSHGQLGNVSTAGLIGSCTTMAGGDKTIYQDENNLVPIVTDIYSDETKKCDEVKIISC